MKFLQLFCFPELEQFQTVLIYRCSSEVGIDLCYLCKSIHAHSYCSPHDLLGPYWHLRIQPCSALPTNITHSASRHPLIHSAWISPLYVLQPVFCSKVPDKECREQILCAFSRYFPDTCPYDPEKQTFLHPPCLCTSTGQSWERNKPRSTRLLPPEMLAVSFT